MGTRIVAALCVLLVFAGIIKSCRDQQLCIAQALSDQDHLDRAGVIGWVRLDPGTKQLYFVGR